jgi:hypothetical protein
MDQFAKYQSAFTILFFMVGMLGIMFFIQFYLKDRKRQRELEAQRLASEERQREELRALEERRIWTQKESDERLRDLNLLMLNKLKEAEDERTERSSGGYIILDLPDNMRSLFSDLLKGFEDYAKLKGYHIIFSVDNSIPHKIAFKFTIQDDGVNVSTTTVRKDIREYIEKVKSGESFDNLPVVISPEEHSLVSTTLKNRISFLQHNYNLEKNAREHYERLFAKLSSSPNGFGHQPTIFIQTGGVNNPRNLLANNSSNILQGEEVLYENNSDNSDHSQITISNSFNKRKEQITKLKEVIDLLKQEKEINEEDKQNLITNFDKIKEELTDEETPNKSMIYKWFSNTKRILENVVLAHHTNEAIHWIYENFNFVLHHFPK